MYSFDVTQTKDFNPTISLIELVVLATVTSTLLIAMKQKPIFKKNF